MSYNREQCMQVTSGNLVIAGTTDYFPEARRIKLKNGWYRVRVNYANLTKLSEDGLVGEDRYELIIWPDQHEKPMQVINQRRT